MYWVAAPKIGLLLFIGLLWTVKEVSGSDVIVKSQSEQEIVIEFSAQQWTIYPEIVNGKAYYKARFDKCCFKTSAKQPLIPERNVVVGIPFESQVSCELLEIEKSKTIDGKLIPTPTFGGNSIAEFAYLEDQSIYQAKQSFPQQLVELSPPAIMRDHQVVMARFYPIQFFPQLEQIQLFNKIVIRITFSGGHREQNENSKFDHYSLDNQLLINPIQAAKWKRSRFSTNQSSLRKTGFSEYYRILLQEEGIYKISGTDLIAAGIDLTNIKPDRIKIFNNGGLQLPTALNEQRCDSLVENCILVSDGQDGSFDLQDFILFYGKSVNGWKYNRDQHAFSHYLNPYTRENVYWLCWQEPDSGKRIVQKSVTPATSVIEVNSFCDYVFIEDEYKNLLNSGTIWLGHYFNTTTPKRTYQLDLPGILQSQEVTLNIKLAGISGGEHLFKLYFNDSFIAQVPGFYSSSSEYLNISIKQFNITFQASLQERYNRLAVEYVPGSDISLAYLDWVEFSAHRELKAKNDQLIFYSPDSAGFYNYHLNSFTSNEIQVYDITNYHYVVLLNILSEGSGAIQFVDSINSDIPKKYLALTPQAYKSPTKIERDTASNCRDTDQAADFIIISYDDFYDAALALKSLRENCDSLSTVVVKISDVFDEFSWGLVDPTAIRDFIKYAYDHWQKKPSYVLLFGDGDYDYKNLISPSDPNWILTFETSDLNELSSRVRDDWYVCVDGNDNLLDLAIGRIPVKNPDEAFAVVRKIIDYVNSPEIGEWCNTITMVADDEFEQGGKYDPIDHIPDTDRIAENLIPKNYNKNKIYLTEYPIIRDASVSGIRKPAAHEALLRHINQGSLIINFIGHGNEEVWTHEHILALAEDLPRIDNGQRQAFWIASTCNFARFDNPNFQSFAEQLVTTAQKGAIAVFAASRLAEPFANVSLNRALYRFLFYESQAPIRLGDVIRLAKNSTGNFKNDQLFNLLGDPTLYLTPPACSVKITNYTPDSMKALSKMGIQGRVEFIKDSIAAIQGQILFKAFDSQKHRSYVVNQWKTYSYKLPGNTIFCGEVSVTDNQFFTQFFIPKDITYGGSEGKFSAFYWHNHLFGSGNLDNIIVGGSQVSFHDLEGPKIVIGFEGQDFMSGGFVSPNPVLKTMISDSLSGVNIAGDIGHKITMILDNNQNDKIELNDFFHYDRNSYTVGHISYPLANLSEGIHYIQIKAWDNSNNSSDSQAEFTIAALDHLIIRDLFNYPNPFSNSTEFTFWANHDCDVEIKIYTLSGRLIHKHKDFAEAGFNHFPWNGRDQDGDALANGVYLYKVCADCTHGGNKIHAEQIEKCVIIR